MGRNELSSNLSRTAGLVIASEGFDGTQNDYASRTITVPSNGILKGEPVTGGVSGEHAIVLLVRRR